ncbi:YrdB family protein [Microbacterium aureliae]
MPESPDTAAVPADSGLRARPSVLDVLALLSQLFAVVTLAIWGFAFWAFPWNIVVGIGAPLLAVIVWALFVSPRAVLAVHPFVRAVIELLVYLAATMAWWSMGATWVGLIYAVVAVTLGVLAGRRRIG